MEALRGTTWLGAQLRGAEALANPCSELSLRRVAPCFVHAPHLRARNRFKSDKVDLLASVMPGVS